MYRHAPAKLSSRHDYGNVGELFSRRYDSHTLGGTKRKKRHHTPRKDFKNKKQKSGVRFLDDFFDFFFLEKCFLLCYGVLPPCLGLETDSTVSFSFFFTCDAVRRLLLYWGFFVFCFSVYLLLPDCRKEVSGPSCSSLQSPLLGWGSPLRRPRWAVMTEQYLL